MVFDYLITLKKKNQHFIDWFNYLLYLIAISTFLYTSVVFKTNKWLFIIISFFMILWWGYSWYLKKIKAEIPYYRTGLFFAVYAWYQDPLFLPWLSFFYAIIALLERQAKFPSEIGFSEELIVVNSFPKKKYSWNEINNALIKDGILTVDFKNNMLIQKEIEDDVSTELETEFNHFCQQQLQLRNTTTV